MVVFTNDFNLTAGEMWSVVLGSPINEPTGVILSVASVLILYGAMILIFRSDIVRIASDPATH